MVITTESYWKGDRIALPLMEGMRLYALHGDLQIDNNLIECNKAYCLGSS